MNSAVYWFASSNLWGIFNKKDLKSSLSGVLSSTVNIHNFNYVQMTAYINKSASTGISFRFMT